MSKLEILDYQGEGFGSVLTSGTWKIACINYGEKVKRENICRLGRHTMTDEAFALVKGSAVLIIGEEKQEHKLQLGKVYNVPKNTWHAIALNPDAQVLVVENSDTSAENSEYIDY